MEMASSGVDVGGYEYHQAHNSHYSSSWESFSFRISRILYPETPPVPPGAGALNTNTPCPFDLDPASLPPTQEEQQPGFSPPQGPPPGFPPPPQEQQPGSAFGLPPPPLSSSGYEAPRQLPSPHTITEERALSYAPKSMALLSILGSAWILYEIFVKDRKKLRSIYHKIIALMSTTDLLSSIWLFVGHWAVPPLNIGGVTNNASGSVGACTAQGFFFQLGMATPLYNVSLSAYSLLLIRYRWRDAMLQESRLVTGLLMFSPLLFGLITATIGLVLDLYALNPSTSTCNISPLPPPPSCTADECDGEEGVSLRARGWIFALFTLAPLWSTLLLTACSSILIVRGVKAQEQSASRWSFAASSTFHRSQQEGLRSSSRFFSLMSKKNDTSSSQNITTRPRAVSQNKIKKRPAYPKARKVTVQSICFVAAFLLTWLVYLIYSTILLSYTPNFYKSYPLELIASVLLPGQGFFNFLVFIRPRYVHYRERHPESGIHKMVYRVLQVTFFGRINKQQSKRAEDGTATSSTSVATPVPPHLSRVEEVTTTASAKQETTVPVSAACTVSPCSGNNANETPSVPTKMPDDSDSASSEHSSSPGQDDLGEPENECCQHAENEGADYTRQQDSAHKDGTPPDIHDINVGLPDLEGGGFLPAVADAEHEHFLFRDISEEEFEILFYSDQSSDSFNSLQIAYPRERLRF